MLKFKRKNRRTSFRSKILLAFLIMIVLLSSLNLYMVKVSTDYNNRYNDILNTIIAANSINEHAGSISLQLRDILVGKLKAEDSTHKEIQSRIAETTEYIAGMIQSQESKVLFEPIEKQVEALLNNAREAEEGFSSSKLGESAESVKEVRKIEEFLKESIQSFILFEVKQSETLKESIETGFKLAVTINIVFLALILVFSTVYLRRTIKNIADPLNNIKCRAESIASGVLDEEALKVSTNDELRDLADAFNTMSDNLRKVISRVHEASGKVHNASSQLTEITVQNSSANQEISASVVEMASGIQSQNEETKNIVLDMDNMYRTSEGILDSSRHILGNARESVKLAGEGSEYIKDFMQQLELTQKHIEEATASMEQLNINSQKMNEILSSVTTISSQTNLLALNASIEAARAGEAGRGFAVVANEIKCLADETTNSAKKIGDLIVEVQKQSEVVSNRFIDSREIITEGSTNAEKANEFFSLISDKNIVVNKDIEVISKDLSELITRIKGINKSMAEIAAIANSNGEASENISAVVEQQTASTEEVTASAMTLSDLANNLDNLLSGFKL